MAMHHHSSSRPGAGVRCSEASGREQWFAMASVLAVSACIYALTQMVMRWSA